MSIQKYGGIAVAAMVMAGTAAGLAAEPPDSKARSQTMPAQAALKPSDPRVRTYVLPSRIVWVSEKSDQSSVTQAERLLQAPQGQRAEGSGCRMENKGAPASVLVDFGRELTGGVQLAAGGPSGTVVKVRVRFGESVAEAMAELGDRGACNDHAIRDGIVELPSAGTCEVGLSGFRFARLDLLSQGELNLESIRAISLMRPMPQLGSFASSDERLNQIWATAAYTMQLCCQDYILDGVKRDRMVWMGDIHPGMMTLMAAFGPQEVFLTSMEWLRVWTPADKHWMNYMPAYTLWWIRAQHDWYRYTGDLVYLKKQHDYLKTVCAKLVKEIGPDNRCALTGFLDWPSSTNGKAVKAGMQALMIMAFEDGARMAAAMGDAELQAECRTAAERLRSAVPSPEGINKQAAALLVLANLGDAKSIYEQVLARNGVQGVSAFFGYYMLEAMAKAGDVQRGIDTVRAFWGGMLDMWATTFWEEFDVDWTQNAFRIDELPVAGKKDVHGDFGGYCYKGFRKSLCHGWASGPAPWLSAHVLGIQVVEPGCKTVRVKPFLGDLQWAEGSFPTPLGVIKVRHEKQADGSIKSDITAPDGVKVIRE